MDTAAEPLVAWEPQPRQAYAMSCPAFEVFYGGAKGGGKSDFLLGDYLAGYEEWGKAWRGILFRRTYKELEEILIRAKDVFGQIPGARYVGGDQMTWSLPAPHAKYPGRATLRFRSLTNELDLGNYNGHQYPWIGFDELTEYTDGKAYVFMLSCCRSAQGAPCYVRATGNPGRPGHVWVKARFIDIAPAETIYIEPTSGMTRCFIPAKLEDNTKLMKNDPMYEKRLLLQPSHLIKALRYGDWDIIAGQVLAEYSREKHVIKKAPLGEGWYRFLAMDWGFAKPFSIGWYAVNTEGRVIRTGEWYGCTGEPNEGIRMGAKAVSEKAWHMSIDQNATTMVADPACWNKDDDLPSIAETFEAAGFTMVKATNDRINGLNQLHDRLQATGEDGRPMFMVMENCTHWIRTVPYLTADPRNPEDINTALEDHCFPDGTMVTTTEGPRTIESMQPGEYVITRDGPRRVMDVWHEGEHQTVVAHFNNGKTVEATPAHKVWVDGRGFIRIDEMRYGDIVMFREEPCQPSESNTMGSCSGDTLNPSGKRIADISNHQHVRENEGSSPCTEKSGSTNEDQFLKDGRCTTGTETQGTTPSKTSSASNQNSTSATITSGRFTTPRAEDRKLQRGMGAKQGRRGTPSTSRQCGRIECKSSACARNVEGRIQPGQSENQSIAACDVKAVHFVGLTQGTTRTVHDLSVEETHEYFADGLLVSNCYDESRYALMSEFVLNPRRLRVRERLSPTERPTYKQNSYDELRAGL